MTATENRYPADGRPCLRPGCPGRYHLVAVLDRERLLACQRCGDQIAWRALPGDEPMPSERRARERGVPDAEMLHDPAELPARDLLDGIRAERDRSEREGDG